MLDRNLKSIAIQIDRKSLTEVIADIDREIPPCPYTTSAPIIPFVAKNSKSERNFTNNSFEIVCLLRDLLVFDRNTNALNRAPIFIEDIGTELVPNTKLIMQVDKMLAKEGYTREDLLMHYGIPVQLYEYLLSLDYKKLQARNFKPFSWKVWLGIFLVHAYAFKIVESSLTRACNDISGENIYKAVRQTFTTTTNYLPIHSYITPTREFVPIQARNSTVSAVCETIISNILAEQTRFLVEILSEEGIVGGSYQLAAPFLSCESLTAEGRLVKSLGGFLKIMYFFDESSEPDTLLHLFLGLAVTFLFEMMLYRSSFNISLNRFEKLFMFFTLAITTLLSLDAFTDCLGIVDFIINRTVIRDACARACNDGHQIVEMIKGTEQVFRLTDGNTPVSPQLCEGTLNRTNAALLGALISPLSMGAAHLIGLWGTRNRTKGEEEFDKLRKNKFILKKLM